jgi:hypothetical protein
MHEHLMQQVQAMGLKPRVAPELIPRLLLGVLDGLVMQAFVDPEAMSATQAVSAIETVALGLFDLGKTAA